MAVQNVSNTPMGSYPVLVDKNTGGAGIQVVRLDLGVGTSEDRLTSLNGLTTNNPSYATRLDQASATITYVGDAIPGSLSSAAVWRLKRLDETAGLVITYADGNANFDNVWDNRASLSYS